MYNVYFTFIISDGAFDCFYFGAGFHRLHFIIGTAFLAIGIWRLLAYHLTDNDNLGLEGGILYTFFNNCTFSLLENSLRIFYFLVNKKKEN